MLHWGLHYIRVIESNQAIVAPQPVINISVKANHLLHRKVKSFKLLRQNSPTEPPFFTHITTLVKVGLREDRKGTYSFHDGSIITHTILIEI